MVIQPDWTKHRILTCQQSGEGSTLSQKLICAPRLRCLTRRPVVRISQAGLSRSLRGCFHLPAGLFSGAPVWQSVVVMPGACWTPCGHPCRGAGRCRARRERRRPARSGMPVSPGPWGGRPPRAESMLGGARTCREGARRRVLPSPGLPGAFRSRLSTVPGSLGGLPGGLPGGLSPRVLPPPLPPLCG